MRAEFFRPDAPGEVVGTAAWDGRVARVEAGDPGVREALARVFRPTAVVADEPSARSMTASGPVVVEPGDLEWFRLAATVRGEREGLAVRFVTDTPGGWDPAGAYRDMRTWVARRESGGT